MMNPLDRQSVGARTLNKEHILELLSDEETARLSNVEAGYQLTHGETYVDLDHLERGVQTAKGTVGSVGTILSKRSVHANTWKTIVSGLATTRPDVGSSGH